MTKTRIIASILLIFSLTLARCGNSGGDTPGNNITETGAAPVIPAPTPVPAPDPEPGPIDPDLNAPAPSATQAVSADKIDISWQPIPGANYKLFRKLESASAYTQIYSGAEPFYSDTTAAVSLTYQYAVKAVSAQGQSSALSEFDTGWRAFSEGCAAKLNAQSANHRIGLFRNGFRDASAIAIRQNYFFIGGGGRIVMLNAQRDIVGVWNDAGQIDAMASSGNGPVYVLSERRVYKLTDSCGSEPFITLPYNTRGLDITLDASGNVYVSEQSYEKNPRIFRYDATGQLINEWSFPNGGGMSRSLNAIHWMADDSILIADRTLFKLQKYRIDNDQLVKAAEKNLSVIGEPTDIATYGNNILVFVKSNDKMHLIRYHSGFDGGSVTYDIGSNWRTHISEAAIHPATGTLYGTDEAGRSLFACPQPLFICGREATGVAPVGVATDTQKNLYVLHGSPAGTVTKLNAHGAYLAARSLPDYQNRVVVPYGIETEGDELYISATNGQKALIIRLKKDLSGAVTFRERTGNGETFFDLAASGGRIVSEEREDFVSGEDLLTRATFEVLNADGSKIQLPEYLVPQAMMFATGSKVEACSADSSLYYQISGYDTEMHQATLVARLTTQQNIWATLAQPAGVRLTEVRCAKIAGTLFSLDSDAAGNFSVAQRDSELNEVRRFGAARGLIGRTFSLATDGTAAYAATADAIHRFAPQQMSAGGAPQ